MLKVIVQVNHVAPFVGAWIEIRRLQHGKVLRQVAPFVGAWIEIAHLQGEGGEKWSLRSSERGLKLSGRYQWSCRPVSLRSSERGLKFKS